MIIQVDSESIWKLHLQKREKWPEVSCLCTYLNNQESCRKPCKSSQLSISLNFQTWSTIKLIYMQISVCLLISGEENFHIFYYLYDGLEEEGRIRDYFLHSNSNCRSHRYLHGRTGSEINNETRLKNIKSFQQVRQGFQMLGFRPNVSFQLHSKYEQLLAHNSLRIWKQYSEF